MTTQPTTPLLAGKTLLITGALDEQSIAWHVAKTAHYWGARIILTNTALAARMGKVRQLAEQLNAPFIPADLTRDEDVHNLLQQAMEHAQGPLNGILHSVAMSMNIRKKREYPQIDYNFYQKTLEISAISLHRLLQHAWQLDALAEGAAVLTLTYIASQRVFPKYNDMADAKALLESIVRNFGYWYGKRKKVRILAINQSPTWTTAGSSVPGFREFFTIAEHLSPLGNASAQDCANLCVLLFSDLAAKLTMQTIHHDGGFTAMGISPDLLELLKPELFSETHNPSSA